MAWGDFFRGLVDVGKAFLGAAARSAQAVVKEAKQFVDQVWKVAQQAIRGKPESEKERVERELQDVNDRIQRLRKRYQENGSVSPADKRQWQDLRERRQEFNAHIRDLERGTNAAEIANDEKNYDSIKITDDTAHVLIYHVGQSTFSKTCACGRTMVLQWPRKIVTPTLKDFFWACSGWWIEGPRGRVCNKKLKMSDGDFNLFAKLDKPEFRQDGSDLTRIVIDPNRAKRVRAALESIRDEHKKRRLGIKIYRCPTHGESLVLQRKRKAARDILDEYFLGCPRWLPGGTGCTFLVKLKTAAQISSVLDSETKQGVIAVSA